MNKPTIFFSHSSSDEKYISLLKNKLISKTNNALNIFQSSDGESIPFGNNWLHEIEKNLENADIMFVFVSPNSLTSDWIFFEAGFAYSKDIKVIPVGINGVDIGKLNPPINLLQGFNLDSAGGLNNILSIFNREFDLKLSFDFSVNDYLDLIKVMKNDENISYEYLEYIDYGYLVFRDKLKIKNKDEMKLPDKPFKAIKEYLSEQEINYAEDNKEDLYLTGMHIYSKKDDIIIKVSPYDLEENIKIISKIRNELYSYTPEKFWFYLVFKDKVSLLVEDFKITSRIINTEISMDENYGSLYNYKNISFAIDENKKGFLLKEVKNRLRIVFKPVDFEINILYKLIDLLFEISVLNIIN